MFAGLLKVVPGMYTVKRLALGKAQQRFSSVLVDEFTYCWIGINNLPLFVRETTPSLKSSSCKAVIDERLHLSRRSWF
jgi:hypothetical protein